MMIQEKYSEEQMKLRQEVLQILFKKFGNGSYSNNTIYECANEWIEKGHKISSGVVNITMRIIINNLLAVIKCKKL